MPLTSKQVRSLRAESHRLKLKPVVMIGHNGLSENVWRELEQAIDHHELLKIRLPAVDKGDKKALLESIGQKLEADLIQTIGHTAVFYRENTDTGKYVKLVKNQHS